MHRPGPRLLLIAALICAAPEAGYAQEKELKDVERALRQDRTRAEELKRQADALANEIQALRVESISAARKAQDHETRLSATETQLADLERQEAQKVETLAARQSQLAQTLAALQKIALQPSDALLLSPGAPIDTVRSGMLLRAAIPAIESRASALRAELSELAGLRNEIAARREQMAETTASLGRERQRLGALIERKSRARAAAAADREAAQARAGRLAARAKDLRDLMEKVEREAAELAAREAREQAARDRAARDMAEREAREARDRAAEASRLAETEAAPAPKSTAPKSTAPKSTAPGGAAPGAQIVLAQPPNIRPFPSSGRSLVMPARGKMRTRFGQTQSDGRAARGIVIAAREGAQVVAPYDGKVVYAGVFRSYGQILIIEHGGRYHTLLAGLERVDAVVGQWLLAGEPVGILGAPRGGQPELYLELRHAGRPINPLPWLATTGDKVRG